MVNSLTRSLERSNALDAIGRPVSKLTSSLGRGRARKALGGDWLGHPLHPMLTDLPIGFFTSAALLDLVGGKGARRAATSLIGWGLLSTSAAALTGASDWRASDDPAVRRVGLLHGGLNVAGTVAFGQSWLVRRRGQHLRGVLWQVTGSALLTAGGYLGGHLAFGQHEQPADGLVADVDDTGGPVRPS